MVKSRIFYVIGLIGLLLFYIYCNSYTPFVILIVFVSLTIFGIVEGIFSVRKISLDIKPTHPFTTQRVDQQVEFCVTIHNNSIFPISAVTFEVEFQDMSDDGVVKRKIKTPVAAKEDKSVHTVVATSHSAFIECRVKNPAIYDAFGLISFKVKNFSDKAGLLISPVMAEKSFVESSQNVYIIDSDKYSETQKGDDSSQVFEVRNYVPGDDIRRIHWRLSSKQDDLIVKEYSKPIDEDCIVILETGIGSADPEERKFRTDSMLSVFMKLAFELITNEQAFSVCWYSETAKNLVLFEVKTFDDIAPIIEKFLSEKLIIEKNITFIMSEEKRLQSLDKQIYYLYNSSFCDNGITTYQSDRRYCAIDTAEPQHYHATGGGNFV